MPHRSNRDIGALELGFLADKVVQALKAARRDGPSPAHTESLCHALHLLKELSTSVGPSTQGDVQVGFMSLHSFTYAAKALSAGPPMSARTGLRRHLTSLAETLEQLIDGSHVPPDDLDWVDQFFQGLSKATFEHWSFLAQQDELRIHEPA